MLIIIVIGLSILFWLIWRPGAESMENEEGKISLPPPILQGTVSVEEAIASRRSRRDYKDKALEVEHVGQLLWAGQGITDPEGWKRASPSAGATYPARLFLVTSVGGVRGLDAGVYEYLPHDHSLKLLFSNDIGDELARAALGQTFISMAPVNIVIVMEYTRTTRVYGERGERYVEMEAGHIGQNLYLQAESLGLGTVMVGAFNDDEVSSLLRLSKDYSPLAIMPFGHP